MGFRRSNTGDTPVVPRKFLSHLVHRAKLFGMKMSGKIEIFFLIVVMGTALFISGCGPEEHNPVARCTNFGVTNVRRNLNLRVSVDVGRPPLEGVDNSTVKLLKLPYETPVPGTPYYAGDRIIFMPDQPLEKSTSYKFVITDGITDKSGKPMDPFEQEFTTGEVLQVYYVDLLRNYDESTGEIYSIGIYFSEGVNEANLFFGEGSITVYDTAGVAQFFTITYYDDVALAVLNFSYPLTVGNSYDLRIGPYIYSSLDGSMLDGDRDNSTADADPFEMVFSYQNDLIYGITVTDSVTYANPYAESVERCFLWEFD